MTIQEQHDKLIEMVAQANDLIDDLAAELEKKPEPIEPEQTPGEKWAEETNGPVSGCPVWASFLEEDREDNCIGESCLKCTVRRAKSYDIAQAAMRAEPAMSVDLWWQCRTVFNGDVVPGTDFRLFKKIGTAVLANYIKLNAGRRIPGGQDNA